MEEVLEVLEPAEISERPNPREEQVVLSTEPSFVAANSSLSIAAPPYEPDTTTQKRAELLQRLHDTQRARSQVVNAAEAAAQSVDENMAPPFHCNFTIKGGARLPPHPQADPYPTTSVCIHRSPSFVGNLLMLPH